MTHLKYVIDHDLYLGSQAARPPMPNSSDSISVTDSDNGGQVQITRGDILTLRLKTIPGTGYAWQIVQNNFNLLKPLGEPVFEDTGKGMPGIVEYQIFHFKALAPGTNTLKLQYIRQWEKDIVPLKIYSITVQILAFHKTKDLEKNF